MWRGCGWGPAERYNKPSFHSFIGEEGLDGKKTFLVNRPFISSFTDTREKILGSRILDCQVRHPFILELKLSVFSKDMANQWQTTLQKFWLLIPNWGTGRKMLQILHSRSYSSVPNMATGVRCLTPIPALPFTSFETTIKLNSVQFTLLQSKDEN